MTSTASQRQPTLIQSSVILDEDAVRILDRRVFPFEKIYVTCRGVDEVAQAIEEMVTQSGGPFRAATAAMILAARQAARTGQAPQQQARRLHDHAHRLIATRRTNGQMAQSLERVLDDIDQALAAGHESFDQVVTDAVHREWSDYEESSRRLGEAAAGLLPDGARVLTHCWGESVLISTLQAMLADGKDVSVIATETRPYLQGSRLTAESVAEMGIPTKVITDGMGASVMRSGDVDFLVTAADRVTSDGYVINKVGTLQLAIAAKEFGIPYYALAIRPDLTVTGPDAVPLENRDGDEVLSCRGVRTASWNVQGIYPAFDVTDPRYVTAIVTSRGPFSPENLRAGHEGPDDAGEPAPGGNASGMSS